jgi:hypothetical protein
LNRGRNKTKRPRSPDPRRFRTSLHLNGKNSRLLHCARKQSAWTGRASRNSWRHASQEVGWNFSPQFGHSTRSKSTRSTRFYVIVNPHSGHALFRDASTLSRIFRDWGIVGLILGSTRLKAGRTLRHNYFPSSRPRSNPHLAASYASDC